MSLDPGATLFNLYDNTTGTYLQGGQQDTNTLAGWLSTYATLATAQLQGIWIGEGLGAGNTGPESLTVNSLTVATTPLPAPLPLLVSGLGVLGYLGFRRRARNGAAV